MIDFIRILSAGAITLMVSACASNGKHNYLYKDIWDGSSLRIDVSQREMSNSHGYSTIIEQYCDDDEYYCIRSSWMKIAVPKNNLEQNHSWTKFGFQFEVLEMNISSSEIGASKDFLIGYRYTKKNKEIFKSYLEKDVRDLEADIASAPPGEQIPDSMRGLLRATQCDLVNVMSDEIRNFFVFNDKTGVRILGTQTFSYDENCVPVNNLLPSIKRLQGSHGIFSDQSLNGMPDNSGDR